MRRVPLDVRRPDPARRDRRRASGGGVRRPSEQAATKIGDVQAPAGESDGTAKRRDLLVGRFSLDQTAEAQPGHDGFRWAELAGGGAVRRVFPHARQHGGGDRRTLQAVPAGAERAAQRERSRILRRIEGGGGAAQTGECRPIAAAAVGARLQVPPPGAGNGAETSGPQFAHATFSPRRCLALRAASGMARPSAVNSASPSLPKPRKAKSSWRAAAAMRSRCLPPIRPSVRPHRTAAALRHPVFSAKQQ